MNETSVFLTNSQSRLVSVVSGVIGPPLRSNNEARLRALEGYRVKLQSLSRIVDRDEEIAGRMERNECLDESSLICPPGPLISDSLLPSCPSTVSHPVE